MNDHDDFELKRKLDALPRAIEPPEDLWPSVRARLRPHVATVPRWRRPQVLRLAALLVVFLGSAAWLAVSRHRAATWTLSRGAGPPRVFHAGESLATGPSPVRFAVGTIGTVDVEAGARVRLLESRATRHRLALDRGTIRAAVTAPPRLFIVETPSGTAVDLGCAYTLDVDSLGNSTIHVTLGWVSFEDHGRESLIPAGMRAAAAKGGAVGTPYRDDAPDSLRAALARFDAAPSDGALAVVLASARRSDAVTLWHLVARTRDAQRDQVVARLLGLVPPPEGVAPEAILRNDRAAMQLYWEKLPGTLPITPDWRKRIRLWWLKVAG